MIYDDISKNILEDAVLDSNSFMDVVKKLGFDPSNSIKKRIERRIRKLGINVDHFSSIRRVKEYKLRYVDPEKLKFLVEKHNTLRDILFDLDLLPVSSNYLTLKKYLKKYNIVYKFDRDFININYNRDELYHIVSNSKTFKECLLKLNIRAAGGNYRTLKKYINLYKLDISHFDSVSIRNEKLNNFNKSLKFKLSDILIENSTYSRTNLKKRLYEEKILERKCCLCGQDENWNGMKISLILDHINGIYNDNRIENLRIVCPNCNAGLDTFAGKNTKKERKKYFCDCGNEVNQNSNFCSKCYGQKRRKVERPNIEDLKKEIEDFGYSATSRKYGVSDNAVRKWLNKNQLNEDINIPVNIGDKIYSGSLQK